jgi:hypothetical protein
LGRGQIAIAISTETTVACNRPVCANLPSSKLYRGVRYIASIKLLKLRLVPAQCERASIFNGSLLGLGNCPVQNIKVFASHAQ